MGRDNKDRYGYRHRKDSSYGLGESKPGDVGDSKGTIHDRATSDNNVIIDGKAQNYESHKRSQSKNTETKKSSNSKKSQNSKSRRSQKGQFAELDGKTVEVTVERVSGSGNPIATYRGVHVHVPHGNPGNKYEVELDAQSGYFVGKETLKE
ncbi:hypothetical protein [Haloarchaeobius sp. FL176]|uniref:hypothetical protein n=1 Tax=Haloarchaeobius sp. FL176 TaxID=2967129 RepID=UPI0021494985|nr:hypothetical protein [Haloarchaeobius sp. FL176]